MAIEDMKLKINVVREQLHKLMSYGNSSRKEIIKVSEELDALITQFNEMKEKTEKNK